MGVRSLFAGVSGLRNFQQQLDIIGNNISNSQTAGFKSSRITFQDLLSQTTRGATGSGVSVGGTNPQQFGLGSSIGAIDTDHSQGNLLTTGRQLDLAISGNGLFKVSNGNATYYTRNGAFDLDESGFLISTTSGFIVQGYNAQAGTVDKTSVGNIQIPIGIVLPAQETTSVDLVGNLDSTSEQIGSVHESESTLATEDTTIHTNDLDGLFAVGNLNARVSGLQSGISTVSVAATDGDGASRAFTLTYVANDAGNSDGNFNSLAGLIQELDNGLTGCDFNATDNGDGSILVAHTPTAGAGTFNITSTNSGLNTALTSLIGAYAFNGSNTSDEFLHTAEGTDQLINLRDSTGTSLGLADGNVINIGGTVNDVAITGASFTVDGLITPSTFDNLNAAVRTAFGIDNSSAVTLNSGKMRITSDGGTNYEVGNINISTAAPLAANFNGIFDVTAGNWSKLNDASDNHTTSFIAHDSDGVKHTITIKYNIRTPLSGQIRWVYDIESTQTSSGDPDSFVSSNQGTILFNPDGSLNDFSPGSVTIEPVGDPPANTMSITLSPGTTNGYDGLVSFENTSSARFSSITGYASGELQNITVNSEGVITGNFTNGQNQVLSQLILSKFDNPAGLEKVGGNMFNQTLNSGVPTDAEPGNAGRGSLIPASLEGSNVDLAKEFVDLITAQRGFQTNARMITAANDILGELVNLVR